MCVSEYLSSLYSHSAFYFFSLFFCLFKKNVLFLFTLYSNSFLFCSPLFLFFSFLFFNAVITLSFLYSQPLSFYPSFPTLFLSCSHLSFFFMIPSSLCFFVVFFFKILLFFHNFPLHLLFTLFPHFCFSSSFPFLFLFLNFPSFFFSPFFQCQI